MKESRGQGNASTIPALMIILLFAITAALPLASSIRTESISDGVSISPYPGGYDPEKDPLVKQGFRPRFPSPDSPFIQTLAPMPEDAVMHPYGWVPQTLSGSPTRAAEWTLYYNGTHIDVYVDTSSSGGGDLSSSEENQLDRIIDDFEQYAWPRVKDYFDPNDIVYHVDFKVHKIDGPSGTGGYYQPGTDEFHLDRDDFSWGGIIAAHEFQHYVHRQYDAYERLWVDEGCADFAAYLVYGIQNTLSSHVYAYLQWRPRHTVPVDDYTFYADTTTSYYGSSFLFELYMIEHYGGKNYTHALVKSTQRGVYGVNRALAAVGSTDRFDEAFTKFMVATRINDDYAGDGNYSYSLKSYSYGSLNLPLSRSHSGTPVTDSFSSMELYSVNSIRFSSPPEPGETYRMTLTYSAGDPIAALYYETPAPREVDIIDFGSSRSVTLDIEGWGTDFNSFQLITTSTDVSSLSYTLDILDLEPPVSSVSVSPYIPDGENGWYTTTPKITLKSEAGAKIYYSMNGGEQQLYSDPIYPTDGVWNISFHAVDRHDNIEPFNYLNIKVDTRTPTSSMDVDPDLPEDTWYTTPPLITLNTAHPMTTLQYKFGNDEYTNYTGPFNPPEGLTNLFWRSVDQAGNMETERSRLFKVDTIPPTLEYEIFPALPDGENGFYRTTPRVTLRSDDSEAIYYSLNGGDMLPYIGPFTIQDGTYTVRMLAIDQAGNRGDQLRFDIKVDTTSPHINGSFGDWEYDPDNSSSWLSFAPVLTLEGSESGMLMNYSLNGGAPVDYTKPVKFEDGVNEIWIYGVDPAGNPAEPLRFFLKIDRKAPFVEPGISSEPVNGWYLDRTVEVELTLSGDDERSSPVNIRYKWMGEEAKDYRSALKVPEGYSTLMYWAVDAAGNRMEARSIQFKKDSSPPSVAMSLQGPADGVVQAGSEILVDLSDSSDGNGISFYGISINGSTDFRWSPDPNFSLVLSEPGTYTITAYVKDGAGNVAQRSQEVVVIPVESGNGSDVQSSENGNHSWILYAIIGAALFILLMALAVMIVVISKHHKKEVEHIPPPPGHPVFDPHSHPQAPPPRPPQKRPELPSPPRPPEHIS